MRPTTTAEVQTPQKSNLFVAIGGTEKKIKNGIYGPGIMEHSNTIINHIKIQTQTPDLEYIYSGWSIFLICGICTIKVDIIIINMNQKIERQSL